MLLRKKFYLQIEYHWYCINLLKKQLNDSNETQNKKIHGKINYHKKKANSLSYQYQKPFQNFIPKRLLTI